MFLALIGGTGLNENVYGRWRFVLMTGPCFQKKKYRIQYMILNYKNDIKFKNRTITVFMLKNYIYYFFFYTSTSNVLLQAKGP